MSDQANGTPIDPADYMRGQMVMALREVERRFPGAHVTIIVSAPGTAMAGGEAQYSHATSAKPDDLAFVLRQHLAEIEK